MDILLLFLILFATFSGYFLIPKIVCKLLFNTSKSIIKILYFVSIKDFAKLIEKMLFPTPLVPLIQNKHRIFPIKKGSWNFWNKKR